MYCLTGHYFAPDPMLKMLSHNDMVCSVLAVVKGGEQGIGAHTHKFCPSSAPIAKQLKKGPGKRLFFQM